MAYLWYWPAGGWDFDKWKANQKWTPIHSEQSGKSEPIPLTNWKSQAAHWREISDQILGSLTDKPPATMRWEFLGDEFQWHRGEASYVMQRMRYSLTDKEWGFAWLLQPRGIDKPKGAVIALHQTQPHGKGEAVGFEVVPGVNDGMNYASELAAAGFMVFAPDAIAFGERLGGDANALYNTADDFFTAQPDGSVMRKMAYDTTRACDLLKLLPQTKDLRIGCLGHSHGAYGTLFAMVHDQRIEAGVISCGMNLLRKDPSPQRWWRMTALIPRLGFYEKNINDTPIDFHHWLAMISPRPLLVTAGTQDLIFPNCEQLKPALKIVASVYAEQNAEKNFHTHVFDGGHSFSQGIRQEAYNLLEASLA